MQWDGENSNNQIKITADNFTAWANNHPEVAENNVINGVFTQTKI